MKPIIEKENINSVEELCGHIPFGVNCRLCLPYIELVIMTGETAFSLLDPGAGEN